LKQAAVYAIFPGVNLFVDVAVAVVAGAAVGYALAVRRRPLLSETTMMQTMMLGKMAADISTLQDAILESQRSHLHTAQACRHAFAAGADITDELDEIVRALGDGLALMQEHRA
jgi:hypothetical protein